MSHFEGVHGTGGHEHRVVDEGGGEAGGRDGTDSLYVILMYVGHLGHNSGGIVSNPDGHNYHLSEGSK